MLNLYMSKKKIAKRFGHVHFSSRELAGLFYHKYADQNFQGPDNNVITFTAATYFTTRATVPYINPTNNGNTISPTNNPNTISPTNNPNTISPTDNTNTISPTITISNTIITSDNQNFNNSDQEVSSDSNSQEPFKIIFNDRMYSLFENSNEYIIIASVPTIHVSSDVAVEVGGSNKVIFIIGTLQNIPDIGHATPIKNHFKNGASFEYEINLNSKVDRCKKIQIDMIVTGLCRIIIKKKRNKAEQGTFSIGMQRINISVHIFSFLDIKTNCNC